jgi:peptidoglycan/LPS O-acetylase OafA/YrhL
MSVESLSGRVAGADGLRAIACLLVVWHHTAQKLNPEGAAPIVSVLHFLGMRGEVGVSLFFVLSGCLLSLPFWKAFVQREKFPSIGTYALNRAARIAPAFWVNLIICNLLAVWLFKLEFSLPKFLAAFFFVNSYDYKSFFPAELNGPLWSIGLEVSCYVLLPLALFAIFKLAKSMRSAVLGMIGILVTLQALNPLFIRIFMTDRDQKGWEYGLEGGAKLWLPYWNIGSFFTQFLLGSLAALVIVHLRSKGMKQSSLFDAGFVLASLSALLLVVARLTPGSPDPLTQQPYVSPFYALLMASSLVFASQSRYVSQLLDNRLFSCLAKLSFGIYLWHVVVMELIARMFMSSYVYYGLSDPLQWALISALVLAVSLGIAAASWKFLEAPVLKAVKRSRSGKGL